MNMNDEFVGSNRTEVFANETKGKFSNTCSIERN
jgi:hypothetical protein